MTSKGDPAYRLRLARQFLEEAEQDFDVERWRSCVDCSQLSVENSGKAIIALCAPVGKTHEPADQISGLLRDGSLRLPEGVSGEDLLEAFGRIGAEEHFKTDYGDEDTRTDPWQLFGKDEAKYALDAARLCLVLAEKIAGGPDNGT